MKHLYLLFFITISLCLNAQETFFVTYEQQADEFAHSLIQNGDEGYLIAGSSDENRSVELLVKKVDFQGIEIWSQCFESSYVCRDNAIALDDNGDIVVLLNTKVQDTSHVVIKKLDQNGNEIISKTISHGTALNITKMNNDFIITGFGRNPVYSLVLKIDQDLNLVWEKEYFPVAVQEVSTLAYDAAYVDDYIYILGGFDAIPSYGVEHFAYILKIDQQGDSIWAKTFDEHVYQYFESIIVNSSKNLIVQGSFRTSDNFNSRTSVKCITQEGEVNWSSEIINENGYFVGGDIKECVDGGYISCGGSGSQAGQQYISLFKTGEDGENIWTRLIEKSYRNNATSLLVTENNLICSGGTYIPDSKGFDNIFLMQTDLEGNLNGIGSIQSSTKSICIAPNPASEYSHLELHDLEAGELSIDIFDLSGRNVYHAEETHDGSTTYTTKLDLEQFQSGVYAIQVQTSEKRFSEKLIVK